MSLEALAPSSEAPATLAGADLATSLQSVLLGGAAPEPATPAAPGAPVVETPPPVEPATPAPVAEPETPVEENPNKLPIDDVLEEPTPTEPVSKDKAGYRIQELQTEIKTTYKPKIAELEQTVAQKDSRIKELEGVSTELEELRSFKSTYEKEMGVVELTKTHAYQTAVAQPLGQIATRAAEIAEAYGMDVDKVYAAIEGRTDAERRAMLKEVTSGLDLDQEDAFELRTLIKDAQPILAKRDELYSNADAALLELQASREKETSQQAAARATQRATDAVSIADRVVKALPFLKGATPAIVEEIKQIDPDALPDYDKVYNVLAGKLLGKSKLEVLRLQSENDALLDELEKFRGASPRVEGGLAAAPATGRKHTDLATALTQGLGLS